MQLIKIGELKIHHKHIFKTQIQTVYSIQPPPHQHPYRASTHSIKKAQGQIASIRGAKELAWITIVNQFVHKTAFKTPWMSTKELSIDQNNDLYVT